MKQDMIVILDLGSTENTVIARAIRALGVYSEIYPHDITLEELKALPNVKGIIINGDRTTSSTDRPSTYVTASTKQAFQSWRLATILRNAAIKWVCSQRTKKKSRKFSVHSYLIHVKHRPTGI